MIDSSHARDGSVPPRPSRSASRSMLLFGAIVIYGAWLAGIDWGAEGPRAGFFPFYVGLLILIASLVNLGAALAAGRRKLFAEWGQLRQVLSVVVPAAIYVALVPWIGLYVASFLLIAVFMRWFGNTAGHDAPGLDRRAGARLPHVREMVPGAAAEGAARRNAGL